jgi:ATP-dependent Clp protease ATP-binding subunit ClpA
MAGKSSRPTHGRKKTARKKTTRAATGRKKRATKKVARGKSPASKEKRTRPERAKAAKTKTPRKKTTRTRTTKKTPTRTRKAATRPIVRDETTTLLEFEELLKQRIVGKDDAIQRVANTIRIRRTSLDFKPHRPDGSFLIVGPAGVGKTEFANAVAEVLLGSDSLVVNLDMADYTEEEDVEDLLVTAYPGAEAVLVEGALTTPVRKNPKSVILLRGIERAHTTVLRLLLHILERGVVPDAQGEATFSNCIVIATTRLELDEAEMVEQIGFTRSTIPREERCRKILEEQFTPELIAAFNEVLYFNSLTPEDVQLIARYKVNTVLERLKKQKRGVVVSDSVYDTFIREDEVRRAGARYLNRALEEKLFTPLSKYLLENAEARSILIDVQGGKLVIRHRS